ncbi:MAG TPA: phosphate ABC transporter ATP-binding protein [Anaerolineales bacterium]|nr:phosphate ABC transporter ATP-binding protein [Anaerolineae bacterium]HIQ02657.1 phosphate ABC transporter ATP-binding protein [Anaerolineales bacterium]
MDAVYVLKDVRKVYDSRCVLDVAHLEVRRGEILAVVGPSGAGKSTLLRLLNFLEPPDGGTLIFQGHQIGQEPVPLHLRRQVTTVFQRPVLLSASVARNVAYGLRLRGMRDGRREVRQVLERMGLADLARAPARSLSGGEAQRVALARALILRPAALLLDEPTANLDPYNVGLIEETVRGMNREEGTTVVLVTHNIFQARRMAHRVVLLLGGRVVEEADAHAFFEAPRDPRTAAFVRGEMVY